MNDGYFKMVSQRVLPCPQNQLIWKSVFAILQNRVTPTKRFTSTDLQGLITKFLDCYWLGQDAMTGKGNRLVSTPHASYWLGHNILICNQPKPNEWEFCSWHNKTVWTSGLMSNLPWALLNRTSGLTCTIWLGPRTISWPPEFSCNVIQGKNFEGCLGIVLLKYT